MDSNNILFIIIPAAAALLGSIIGTLGIITTQKIMIKKEKNEKIIDLQRAKYQEFITAMQRFMNENTTQPFLEFQSAITLIILFANDAVAKEVNEYYRELVRKTNEGLTVSNEEHTKYQTKIINLMRKDLGIAKSELKNPSLIAFRG